MKKQSKTPLAQLGSVIKNVKGWNDPHIFINNTRHVFSKEDARTMAERYAKLTFKKNRKMQLQKVSKTPEKCGEYRVDIMHGNLHSDYHYCQMQFHDGANLIHFEMELDKTCSGVSTREAFLAVENVLDNGYEQPESWDFLTWEVLDSDEVARRIESQESRKAEVVYTTEVISQLKKDFPMWFQRNYSGKNIKWQHVGSDGHGSTVWKLICDIGEEKPKEYTGLGSSQAHAKVKAMVDAANDLGYTISMSV